MVERGEHGDVRAVRGGVDDPAESRVHARQVVHPSGRQELPLDADPCRGLRVGQEEVPRHRVAHPRPEPRGDVRAAVVAAHADDRDRVALPVDLLAVVHPAVEVDREVRDARDGPGGHEPHAAVGVDHPAGDLQVAVEPRRQERSAVDLDVELLPPEGPHGGVRLDAERGGVGVRAEDAERGRRGRALRQSPGDECAVTDDDVGAGLGRPRVELGQLGEARRDESVAGRRCRVERGGGLGDVLGELGGDGVGGHPTIVARPAVHDAQW